MPTNPRVSAHHVTWNMCGACDRHWLQELSGSWHALAPFMPTHRDTFAGPCAVPSTDKSSTGSVLASGHRFTM